MHTNLLCYDIVICYFRVSEKHVGPTTIGDRPWTKIELVVTNPCTPMDTATPHLQKWMTLNRKSIKYLRIFKE